MVYTAKLRFDTEKYSFANQTQFFKLGVSTGFLARKCAHVPKCTCLGAYFPEFNLVICRMQRTLSSCVTDGIRLPLGLPGLLLFIQPGLRHCRCLLCWCRLLHHCRLCRCRLYHCCLLCAASFNVVVSVVISVIVVVSAIDASFLQRH